MHLSFNQRIEFEKNIKCTTDVSVPTMYRLGYGLVVLIKTKLTKSLILAAKA
jgi:hypothetical protein